MTLPDPDITPVELVLALLVYAIGIVVLTAATVLLVLFAA